MLITDTRGTDLHELTRDSEQLVGELGVGSRVARRQSAQSPALEMGPLGIDVAKELNLKEVVAGQGLRVDSDAQQ